MSLRNYIVRNAIKTPDGTVLESRQRHDCSMHTDAISGKEYMVDGGLAYFHRSIIEDQEDMSVFLSDGHETVREVLKWGTRGVNGDKPLTLVRLCDMDTDHIQACLDTQILMAPQYRYAMRVELAYRELIGS